ncbi:MAG TPA: TraR/DksA C4-type zinc finger protein [Marmoricola sp.]|jgi:DnaK suppressor protein
MPDPVSRLHEERQLVLDRLSSLRADYAGIVEAAKASNLDDEHDPEGSTIAFERSQVGAHIAHAEAHLADIERALERVRQGSYGICKVCGARIPEGRLEARPTAETCVACA